MTALKKPLPARKLTVIPGDGIGPEITEQVIRVLQKVGSPFEYFEAHAGLIAIEKHKELLPESTLESIRTTGLALKGPITTPVGGGYKSLNVTLRQTFDLYANVRPVKSLPGVETPFKNIDLIIVRENTEDLYMGIERKESDDVMESIKRITRPGCQRISEYAFQLAKNLGRKKVHAVHKANIMKLTDGMFLDVFRKVGATHPSIEAKDVIVDNCCMQLVTKPQQFDVIVTENLYGDILSDLCAGLVGGLGVVPGSNIGKTAAIFEAVHGSAPDIAGQGKANPTALLQSAVMMLQHIGEIDKASQIMDALLEALSHSQTRTPDLGGKGSTKSFTDAILSNL
jgi:isocitrate dehydrogenase (NAD+)